MTVRNNRGRRKNEKCCKKNRKNCILLPWRFKQQQNDKSCLKVTIFILFLVIFSSSQESVMIEITLDFTRQNIKAGCSY